MKLLYIYLVICSYQELTEGWTLSCWLGYEECCTDSDIPGDIEKLRVLLKNHVYGQPLVDTAVDALAAHWDPHVKSDRALVLSFHGLSGSGKNYVSKFIASCLYWKGTSSKHVTLFVGRKHFPEEKYWRKYLKQLQTLLIAKVTACTKQLFIFDEADKMSPEILNGLKPYIDFHDNIDGADFTQSIFIFISNTGGDLIKEQYHEYWKQGKQREHLELEDFENLIAKGAFNEEGGFYHVDPIKHSLISHYIPFLPMERKEVTECIKDQFRKRHVYDPKSKHIQQVLDSLEWGPDETEIFSKTGCHNIDAKVAVLVKKYYTKKDL